ncbi:MAG: thiamine diphosphokinase [Bacillota bacterium]
MRCFILAGGPITNYEGISPDPGDLVICADGGARHAGALGVVPALVIGDMDSVDPGLLEEFAARGCRVVRFPRDKDEVDTELALNAAISANPDEIIICGATGGRLDHTLANIQLLALPAQRGIRSSITGRRHRVTLVTPDLPYEVVGRGSTFSLLPLTTRVAGVTARGAAWELNGAEFVIGKPYGVSNRVEADKVQVSIAEGMLLVIELLRGAGP